MKYWERRLAQIIKGEEARSKEFIIHLENEHQRAIKSIEKDIAYYLNKIADNEGLSMAKAREMLSRGELESLRMDLEDFMKLSKGKINEDIQKRLENASSMQHISKLNATALQMEKNIAKLYGNLESNMAKFVEDTYTDTFYKSNYYVQNLGGYKPIEGLSSDRLSEILNTPWAPDGKNFSGRIWGDQEGLISTLRREMTQACLRGDNPDRIPKILADKFNVELYKAKRLVHTENAFFSMKAVHDSFKIAGFEEYQISATLDTRTSDICRDMDGKVFKMSEYEVGVTAPPFHCNCRSAMVPYDREIEEMMADEGISDTRMARDPVTGKSGRVKDMDYKEWYSRYVVKSEKNGYKNSENKVLPENDKIKRIAYEKAIELGYNPLPDDKVVEVLRKDSDEWIKNLTEDEKKAITKYTYNGVDKDGKRLFEKINGYLEGRYSPTGLKEEEIIMKNITNINQAILKIKLKNDIIVYRNDRNPTNLEGIIKKFLSTSATRRGTIKKNPNVVIIVPKGSKGGYIENLAEKDFKKQREFLINKDSKLRKLHFSKEFTLYVLED